MNVRRFETGFTLVELLVSLAILALFSAMLLGGLQRSATFFARAGDHEAADDRVGAAQLVLRTRLAQLRAISRANSSVPVVDFAGDRRSVTWIGPPLDRSAPDALWRYRVVLSSNGDLVLYFVSTLDDRYNFVARDTIGWQPVTLMENVRTLDIDYFGQDPNGTGLRWQTGWLARAQPPDLVRIRLGFAVGDRRVWPELIVRPMATTNTACHIDPLTARCREVAS